MQELFNFTPYASSGDGFNLSATVKDGQPWFIAADVCRSLEIKNSRQALARLPATEKGVISTYTPGGVQEVGAVNESGLYRLIFTSRKAAAERFKDWVFDAVLPSIRKHGGYINGMEALRPESQAEVLQVVQGAAIRTRSELDEEHRDRFRLLKAKLR
jgi:prophage antirepressor-like protein